MFGANKEGRVVRSSIGRAVVSMAPLMNKCETVSTDTNKRPVCVHGERNGINWPTLCVGCTVPLNVSTEGSHTDNEAVTAECQQWPWTSTGPTVLVTPAAAQTDGQTDGPSALPVTSPAPSPCTETTISPRGKTVLISARKRSLIRDVANDMLSILIRPLLAFAQEKKESKTKASHCWSNVAYQHLRPKEAQDVPLQNKAFSSWFQCCVLVTTSFIYVNSTRLVKTLWGRNN